MHDQLLYSILFNRGGAKFDKCLFEKEYALTPVMLARTFSIVRHAIGNCSLPTC